MSSTSGIAPSKVVIPHTTFAASCAPASQTIPPTLTPTIAHTSQAPSMLKRVRFTIVSGASREDAAISPCPRSP